MRVVIVGGGIGGLTAARALRARGIDAEVYEQAGELREIGAAVALSANGTRELIRLGIGDELAAISTEPTSLCIRRGDDGSLICRDPMGESQTYRNAFGAPYCGVHRVPLLRLLAAGIDDDKLHLGHRLVDLGRDGTARFENGAEVTADVVIAADGVHSTARRALGAPTQAVFSQTIGYRGLVRTADVPSLPEPGAIQFWANPGAHLLHYPIDGGDVINFLAVVRVPTWEASGWVEECGVAESAERFADWHPGVREMIGAVPVSARWALHDHLPLARWHHGRVGLLGDAAHAMLPHQGQGANQSIEDAVALAVHIAAAADSSSVETALGNYTGQRRDRTARVQDYSRRAVDLLHAAPERFDERDQAFANLPVDLAWIHGHDALAAADALIDAPDQVHA